MSMWMSYEVCKTKCICNNCSERSVSCAPCMDCTGHKYTGIPMKDGNGYITQGYRIKCEKAESIGKWMADND